MSLSVSLSFRTCYIIKIFQMTTKMVKQLITMTIMRMTSTLGCYCHFFFSFFFFTNNFKSLLSSCRTTHGIKFENFTSKLVCHFLCLFLLLLFVCLLAFSDMSIPEDIEEQLSSLNGYFTSDRTVSQASGEDLDFAEDILNF